MSSNKPRPLREIAQAPATPRWKPSTPHGKTAQLHRSGGADRTRRRSGKVEKSWSAHGALRALSKIEAARPIPKSRLHLDSSILSQTQTPGSASSSPNQDPPNRKKEPDSSSISPASERPRLSLPLSSPDPDDEDSNLQLAPTPSVLPDDGDEENFTMKSIEYGRRAVHERAGDGALGLLGFERERRGSRDGRPTFGSIRMSDFRGFNNEGDESEIGKVDGAFDDEVMGIGDDDDGLGLDNGGDTEDLRLLRLRRSLSLPENNVSTHSVGVDDQDEDTFRLHFSIPQQQETVRAQPGAHSEQERRSPVQQQIATRSAGASQSPSIASAESDTTAEVISPTKTTQSKPAPSRSKKQKLSKHGIKVPALPSSLIKRLGMDALTSMGRRKSRIGRDSLKALEQATEWFFEQVGEDLEAYSQHAGRRRRLDESDVLALMKRQRQISAMDMVPSLAKEHLPKDVLRETDLS